MTKVNRLTKMGCSLAGVFPEDKTELGDHWWGGEWDIEIWREKRKEGGTLSGGRNKLPD